MNCLNKSAYTVEEIKSHVNDTGGIETLLFSSTADSKGYYRVRIRDLDVDENITIRIFPNRKMAEDFYTKNINS